MMSCFRVHFLLELFVSLRNSYKNFNDGQWLCTRTVEFTLETILQKPLVYKMLFKIEEIFETLGALGSVAVVISLTKGGSGHFDEIIKLTAWIQFRSPGTGGGEGHLIFFPPKIIKFSC